MFQMTQITQQTQQVDIIVGIDTAGAVVLATVPGLRSRQGFKQLNIQKQKMNFVMDHKQNQQFMASRNFTSQFYKDQLEFVIKTLIDGKGKGNDSASTQLIQMTPINKTVNVEEPRFTGRKAVNIQSSVCVPNLIAVLVDDCYQLVSSAEPKYNQYGHCLSIETYDIQTGQCVQTFLLSIVVDNSITPQFQTFLLQNRVYGTYLFAVATPTLTMLQNVNCLFNQVSKQQRVSVMNF